MMICMEQVNADCSPCSKVEQEQACKLNRCPVMEARNCTVCDVADQVCTHNNCLAKDQGWNCGACAAAHQICRFNTCPAQESQGDTCADREVTFWDHVTGKSRIEKVRVARNGKCDEGNLNSAVCSAGTDRTDCHTEATANCTACQTVSGEHQQACRYNSCKTQDKALGWDCSICQQAHQQCRFNSCPAKEAALSWNCLACVGNNQSCVADSCAAKDTTLGWNCAKCREAGQFCQNNTCPAKDSEGDTCADDKSGGRRAKNGICDEFAGDNNRLPCASDTDRTDCMGCQSCFDARQSCQHNTCRAKLEHWDCRPCLLAGQKCVLNTCPAKSNWDCSVCNTAGETCIANSCPAQDIALGWNCTLCRDAGQACVFDSCPAKDIGLGWDCRLCRTAAQLCVTNQCPAKASFGNTCADAHKSVNINTSNVIYGQQQKPVVLGVQQIRHERRAKNEQCNEPTDCAPGTDVSDCLKTGMTPRSIGTSSCPTGTDSLSAGHGPCSPCPHPQNCPEGGRCAVHNTGTLCASCVGEQSFTSSWL